MDKQSLRASSTDINSMRTSYRSISRSGFIQTLAGDTDTDMRKSRIYNLPSYKKIDLSQRLDMVVVFQTIEITRLSQQIQTLRVALLDCQRQINNYMNYEIQIRQLNDKVCEYENQRASYQQQMQKMNMICQQLYADLQREKDLNMTNNQSVQGIKQELQEQRQKSYQLQNELNKWKNRYTSMQKSKQQQMQQMKLAMESQRKSILNKQMNQLQTKYNTQRQSLQKEIYKLRQILAQQKQTKRIIKIQLSKKEVQVENLAMLKNQIKQYQNRFIQIQNQFMKLNDLLRKKQQQQQKYRQQEKKLTTKLRQYEKTVQKQYLPKINLLENIQKTNKQLKQKCIRMQMQIQTLQQNKIKANKLQGLLNQAGDEIDRLNTMIKDKIKYIQAWSEKYNVMEIKYKQLQQLNQTQYGEIENKLLQKQKQLTRAEIMSKNRLEQLQTIKEKYDKLQNQYNLNIEKNKKDQQKIREINQQSITKIKDLQTKYSKTINENKILKQKQIQLTKYKTQLQPQYKKHLLQLTKIIEQKSQQIQLLNKKFQHLLYQKNQTNQSFLNQIQSINQKNKHITQFADQLHNNVKEKIKQIKLLKQTLGKIDKRVTQGQTIQKKLTLSIVEKQKMFKQMENLQLENNQLFDKHLLIETKLGNRQKELFQKVQEINQLMNQVKYKEEEKVIMTQQMKQQAQELRKSFQRERELVMKVKQGESKIQEMQKSIKLINQKLTKSTQSLQQLQQQHKTQKQRLKDEITRNKQKQQKLQHQLHTTKMQLKKLQSQRQIQNRDYETIIQQLKSQNQKITLQSGRNMVMVETQLKNQLEFNKGVVGKQKQTVQSLEIKVKQYMQIVTKSQQKIKKQSQRIQQLQQLLNQHQTDLTKLQKLLKQKSNELQQSVKTLQQKQQQQQRQRKQLKISMQSKNEQYEKLKKQYDKQRKIAMQESVLRDEEKRKMVRQMEEGRVKMDRLNQELQRALNQGRNSKQFIQKFNNIKLQSQTVNQFLTQIITKYFNTTTHHNSNNNIPLFIQHQILTIKKITQQHINMYKQTVVKYQQKLNKMIGQRQVQLGRYSQLQQQHVRLRDMLITLQSRNKLLQYEIDSNLLQKKNNNSSSNGKQSNNSNIILMRQPQILSPSSSQSSITINKQPSSIILRSSSPQSSLISSSSQSRITKMNKVKEKKNITTLFKSMVDSDSIIQPLCSSGGGNSNGKSLSNSNSEEKGNNVYGVVDSVVEGERGIGELSSSKLVDSKSMKVTKVSSPTKSSSGKTITTTSKTSIITTNNNPNTNNNTQPTFTKKPNPTDMIQSTVFQLSDNIKSSQLFNPFDNTNQNQ